MSNRSDNNRSLPRLKGPHLMSASTILLTTIVCCAFPLSGIAGQNENGMVIYSKGMAGNSAFELKTSIRDQNIRMEFQRKDVESVIYLLDVAKQLAFKLQPTRKVSEEISWPGLTSMLVNPKTKTPPLIKTGKTETIAGYPAEQYVRTNDQGSTSEFWLTQAIQLSPNVFRAITGYTNKLAQKDVHGLAEQGNFELRKIQRLRDGSIWIMSEVLAIERTNLREELFEIPPDFKQVKKQMTENDRVSVSP